MTFAETLELLNWAKANGALQVTIGTVAVAFKEDRTPEKSTYVPSSLKPHETRRALDEAMFGMDLDTLGGTNG